MVNETVIFPADTGLVYAFESESGILRWKEQLPFEGVFNDAVAAGSMVVSANDRGGELFAPDLATGAHRWTTAQGVIYAFRPGETASNRKSFEETKSRIDEPPL